MAKREPTEQEQQEFMDKQGKLYDQKAQYEQDMDLAIGKANPTMWKEAERNRNDIDKEIESNIKEWNTEYGYDEKSQEQEHEKEQEVSQEVDNVQQETEQEEEMEK